MYSGQDSIEYLSQAILELDKSESSHWREYHKMFSYSNGGFEGLFGFGGNRKPRFILFDLLERLMQRKFRKMAHHGFYRIDQLARKIATKQNRTYDLDLLRQGLTISFLQNEIPDFMTPKSITCVIGDGFSSMTSLLLQSQSAGIVILINLNKTLLVDLCYLEMWMGAEVFRESVHLVTTRDQLDAALNMSTSNKFGVIAIQASNQDLLRYCPINLVVNIASMQEMDPPIIDKYFQNIRAIKSKNILFYCCNRIEKQLPDGTITRFNEYPWCSDDQILVDQLCPWHQEFYSFSPPFYRRYDGPIWHRLVNLSTV